MQHLVWILISFVMLAGCNSESGPTPVLTSEAGSYSGTLYFIDDLFDY